MSRTPDIAKVAPADKTADAAAAPAAAAPAPAAAIAGDLKRLQGTWQVLALVVDGKPLGAVQIGNARIAIHERRFECLGMGAIYRGTVEINESVKPRQLDMRYDAGPEKGRTALGIYTLREGVWRLCLTTGKKARRPTLFESAPGSGLALETLRRAAGVGAAPTATFETVPELEGDWTMVSGRFDGEPLPAAAVRSMRRTVKAGVVTVFLDDALHFKAGCTVDRAALPSRIDYLHLEDALAGKTQLGIFAVARDGLTICMAPPGEPRPREFNSLRGDERSLTVWKRRY